MEVHFGDYESAPIRKIMAFRKEYYSAKDLDYLYGDLNDENERKYKIDERSQHFWLQIDSEIVGSLRATPYPFELLQAGEYFRDIGYAYQKHVEFGRLIVNTNRTLKVPAQKLMAFAFLNSLQNGYAGIVAVCRTPQRRLFQKFGLFSVNKKPLIWQERKKGAYWIVEGDSQSISHSIIKRRENIKQTFDVGLDKYKWTTP